MSNSATAAPPQPSKVSQQTVEKAINALLKWRDSKSKTQKPQLLEQDDFINLIVTLKKIPQKGRTNPHKILLPHPFINPIEDAPEFCLIIDDRSKSRVSKDVATKKIKAENIPISKVLKLSKLMTDYRPFEAKRKLCDSYDVFFADKGVIPLLPRLLGKQFFKKKKIPLPVDLKHKNWKEQIDRACSSCLLYLRTGTCSVVKVGKVSMGAKDVMENVMAAINGIAEIVPSKWGNIRSFHLKLLESLALPIYQTVPDLRLKIEVPTKEESKQGETAKETLKDDDKMDDSLSNKMLKKKGRIHEIRYMDSNISEIPDEDEFGDEGEATENDAMDSAETKAKRRKGDKVKNAKPLKKMAKVKKGDEDEGLEQKKKVERGSDSGGKEKKKKTWLYFPNQWKRVTGEGETMAWLLLFLLFHGCSCLVFSHPTLQFLPGFTGPLPFQLETGYVGVDENEIVQLFYYFIKSERNFREDPLMLWLTGGPGCSAISSLAFEIGPLSFKAVEYNGSLPTLLLNPYSWTKVASIIFVDSPVGTGFSYSKTPPASPPSDFGQVDRINQFLKKWLIIHPEFLLNPLYIGGSSYSGIPLPALVQQISNENEQGIKPLRNLQGYVLGSPMTDLTSFRKFRFLFAHGMGLISDEIYEAWKSNCEGGNPSNKECTRAVEAYEMCTSELYENYILAPSCDFASPKPQQSFSERRSLTSHYFHDSQLSVPTLGCPTYGYLLADYWANDYSVRQALHIHEGSIEKWRRCNKNMPYIRDIQNSIPYHANLSVKGYRSLIYNGDHDLTMPFLGTQAWIRSLNYSIVDDWRPWMLSGQVAGYTRTYSNKMTFATIKGGGHTTMFRPEESSVMFKRWISGEPL